MCILNPKVYRNLDDPSANNIVNLEGALSYFVLTYAVHSSVMCLRYCPNTCSSVHIIDTECFVWASNQHNILWNESKINTCAYNYTSFILHWVFVVYYHVAIGYRSGSHWWWTLLLWFELTPLKDWSPAYSENQTDIYTYNTYVNENKINV